jgi:hypothetical protein
MNGGSGGDAGILGGFACEQQHIEMTRYEHKRERETWIIHMHRMSEREKLVIHGKRACNWIPSFSWNKELVSMSISGSEKSGIIHTQACIRYP